MPVTLDYQVQYEVCALLFVLVLTTRYYTIRRFPNRQNRLFGFILVAAVADLLLDIVGAYCIMYADAVPLWVNYAINTIFYSIQVLFTALLMTYIIYAAGCSFGRNRKYLLLLTPAIIFTIVIILNIWTKWIFYVDQVDGIYVYFRGPYFSTLYFSACFCIFVSVFLIFRLKGKLEEVLRSGMLCFIALILAAMIIQIRFPQVLLTGVAIAIAILIMCLLLQNPSDMLDLITGTFNYNAMMLFLDGVASRGEALKLIVADLSGISRINSSYGLLTGNRIFALVGAFLNRLNNKAWVFRMTGTRFLIASTGKEDIKAIASDIHVRFKGNWETEGTEVHITATVRYLEEPVSFESAEEVIDFIGDLYSRSEAQDRSRFLPIERGALAGSRRNAQIERALRTAMSNNEGLSLHYQPIFDTKTGSFPGAEALLRLEDPILGGVSPAEFIPIAEKSWTIMMVDNFVIRKACRYLAEHEEPEYLEINLSAAEFFQNPRARIHSIVQRSGVDPSRICFEVTETAAEQSPVILEQFMKEMIALGYRFALDDFGTGYANITKVMALPFSIAKLDKTLLQPEMKSTLMLRSLLQMFRNIGLETVMEGVETQEQAGWVTLYADHIQGFYYARPMPEAEFVAFLENR